MSKNKYMLYSLLVMLLWGTLFPMVKLGYGAYNIVTTGDILFFAGVRFTICGNQQSYANNAQVTKNRENPVK